MLVRQTILYLPAQLIGPAFQFVAAVAWTHWLSPGDYGVLAYVMAAQELAYLISLAWWSQYMLRYVGGFKGEAEQARYQDAENTILALTSLAQIGVCLFVLLSSRISLTTMMVVATIFYSVSRSLTSHLSERARSAGKIATYTVAQVVGPVAGFGLAFAAVVHFEASASAALAGFAIAQVAGLIWMWRELRLGLSVAWPQADIIRSAVKFGAPLVLAGAIGWVSFNGIRVIVDAMDGPVAVGLISVGWGLGQRLAAVIAMLVTAAAFPLAVKYLQAGLREDALRQVSMSGAILFSLLAPACVGIVMVSHPFIELLIAVPFQAVTFAVLPLAAVAGALRNLRVHTADQVIILFEQTRLNVIVNVVEVVATVAFCFVGLIVWGLPGAAGGCLAGTVVGVVFGFFIAVTRFELTLPWMELGRIAVATLIMSAMMWAIPAKAVSGPLALIIVTVIVGALSYCAAMAVLYRHLLRGGITKARELLSAS